MPLSGFFYLNVLIFKRQESVKTEEDKENDNDEKEDKEEDDSVQRRRRIWQLQRAFLNELPLWDAFLSLI